MLGGQYVSLPIVFNIGRNFFALLFFLLHLLVELAFHRNLSMCSKGISGNHIFSDIEFPGNYYFDF